MAEVLPNSEDAAEMVRLVRLALPASDAANAAGAPERAAYEGGHALTRERFDRVVGWIDAIAMSNTRPPPPG